MAVVLAQAVLHNISGLPIDNTVNDFVFEDSTLSAAIAVAQAAVPAFYNTGSTSGKKVSDFISQTISRTVPVDVKCYDISTTLNGSPHGSPVATSTFTLGNPVSAVDIPSEVAVCFSFHAAYGTSVEEGAIDTSIPSSEEAIDQGAPTTHTGRDRPRARVRGRIYVGPLSFGAVKTSGGAQCTVADDLVTALVGAGGAGPRLLALTGANWRVWSRRNAAVYTVTTGWVDNEFDTQRRRRIKATARTTF